MVTDCRARRAESRGQAVVAAPLGDRQGRAVGIGLDHQSRVVLPVTQDAQIHEHRVVQALQIEQLEQSHHARAGRGGRGHRGGDLLEDLRVPTHRRQAGHKVARRPVDLERGGLVAPGHQVAGLGSARQTTTDLGGNAQRVQHRVGDRHVAEADPRVDEPAGAQGLPEHEHRFGVRLGSVGADELRTGLPVLGGDGLAGLGHAEARARVEDPNRTRVLG